MRIGRRRRAAQQGRGFTLLELMMVISVIALLTGMMTVTIVWARRNARLAKAQTEVRELAKAWKAYWLTYGDWPEDGYYNSVQEMNGKAMQHLLGVDKSHNKQGIAFIKAPVTAADDGFRDPWGTPYSVDFEKKTTVSEVEFYETTVYFPNRLRYAYEP